MFSPFPGMDPYLELPEFWSEFHNRLIVAIADNLAETLSDRYRVAIEKRTYFAGVENVLVGIPDVVAIAPALTTMPSSPSSAPATAAKPKTVTLPHVEEVRESYLEIRETTTGAVVTAIELLSPKNKRSGEGRQVYERKRDRILASLTHLVEIDLLRGGQPLPILEKQTADYRILVSRSEQRPHADLYTFNLKDEIPAFPLPLQPGESEPLLSLQPLVAQVYRRARYHLAIDYRRSLQPNLSKANSTWAKQLLQNWENESRRSD